MWLAMQPRFAQGFARLSPRAFTVDPAGGFALAVARGFHSSPFRHPHAALRVRLEAGRARCAAVGGALMPQRILRLALPSLSFSTSPVSTSRTTNESDASSSSSSSAGPSIFVTLPSSHSAEAAPASPTPAAGSSSLLQELHQVYSDHRWLSIGTFFAAESCSLTVSLFVASNLYESVPVLQSPMVIVALWAGAVIPSLTKPFGLMLIGPCCFALRRLFPGLSGVPWVNPDNFNLLSQLSIAKVRFVSNLVALTRDHGLTILCATRLAFFLHRLLALIVAALLMHWVSSPDYDVRREVSTLAERMLGFVGMAPGKKIQEIFDYVFAKGGPVFTLMLLVSTLLFPFSVLSPVLARRLLYLFSIK